jgi:hypothetical protein
MNSTLNATTAATLLQNTTAELIEAQRRIDDARHSKPILMLLTVNVLLTFVLFILFSIFVVYAYRLRKK